MKTIEATSIKRFDNWTVLIYAEPGVGKTTMVKSLTGKTRVFSVDGMYQVLADTPNVTVDIMDSKKPSEDLGNFFKAALKSVDQYQNFVIDNLSTFQKFWLNAVARDTKNGMPEMRDYGVVDRVLLDFIASMKDLKRNVLIFAHEKNVEVTLSSGRTYTQFQPDVRNMDAIMGIVPLVGRLVVVHDETNRGESRIIVLQPTQSTRAKDQLIGNIKTIGQMDLLPKLQNTLKESN